jgi:hypothetical protein
VTPVRRRKPFLSPSTIPAYETQVKVKAPAEFHLEILNIHEIL